MMTMARPQLINVTENAVSGDVIGLAMILLVLVVAIALVIVSVRQLRRHA
jgi:hypothetical protein